MNQQSANFGQQRQVDFGRYLKSLREERGLSRTQVADDLHINIWDIERGGRSISVDKLIELAKKYDVPPEELLRKKYSPQLPLLDGIMQPTELMRDLKQDLHPGDMEELTRYIAFLLMRRATTRTKS